MLKSRHAPYAVINLSIISDSFSDGEVVTPLSLFEKKLIRNKKGMLPKVKILANGALTKKVLFSGCLFSDSAKEKITKAGAKIEK